MNTIATLLTDIERRLLNEYQQDFPLETRPYEQIAAELGIDEREVIKRLEHLRKSGALSRVGPIVRPNRVGASTLAALAVPVPKLEHIAAIVNSYPEVNHNYEREHEYNLWFVITAADRQRVDAVLQGIALRTGLTPLDLPMLEDYFIDLGFRLQWA